MKSKSSKQSLPHGNINSTIAGNYSFTIKKITCKLCEEHIKALKAVKLGQYSLCNTCQQLKIIDGMIKEL